MGPGRPVGHRVRRPRRRPGPARPARRPHRRDRDRLADRAHARVPAAIEFVAIDPAAIYASAIRTPGLLPNATLVVDHFHLVKLGNDAVTKVRRRVTWGPQGPPRPQARSGVGEPAPVATRPGTPVGEDFRQDVERDHRRGRERADPVGVDREGGATRPAGDRPGRWRSAPDAPPAARFRSWCIDSQIPELLTLATTIDAWWPEINAFVTTGITNARTEGYNRP